METALAWARQCYWVRDLPPGFASDLSLLVMIVERVESCITSEMNFNIDHIERTFGTKLNETVRSAIRHSVFAEYDNARTTRFWSCVQSNLRSCLRYDDSSLLNIGFRLWAVAYLFPKF